MVGVARAEPHAELGKPWAESWTVDELRGNSHQAWDVRFDDTGRVWIGNGSGAQYFDGFRWRLLQAPTSTRIDSPLPRADGRVYVGTTSDLGYFEPDSRAEWRYVSLADDVDDVPVFGQVLKVEATPDGIFYLAAEFLFRYLPESAELSWSRAGGRFVGMATVGRRLYVADQGAGILQFDGSSGQLEAVVRRGALSLDATFLVSGPDERLMVGSEDGLFYVAEGKARRWHTEADDWLRTSEPHRAMALPGDRLGIGSRLGGLMILSRDGTVLRHLSKSQGLMGNWINYAAVGPQGGLWTTHDGGVSRIEIDSAFSYFDSALGLDSVEALARFRGRLFAATATGLSVLTPADRSPGQASFVSVGGGRRQAWSLLATDEALLVGDSAGVLSVRLREGTFRAERIYSGRRVVRLARSVADPALAYAAMDDGILRLRQDGSGWRSGGKLSGYDLPVVYVAEADDGALWFGTTTGAYHRIASPNAWPDCEFDTYDESSGVPKGNAHLFRAGGKLLFGTWDGFRIFDGERFVEDPSFPEPLVDTTHDIHRLAEGPDGGLWIRAGGSAGVAMRKDDGRWSWDVEPLKKLANLKVSAIHVDPDGVVWLGRKDGVVRYDSTRWSPPPPMPAPRVVSVTVPSGGTVFGGAVKAGEMEPSPLDPEIDALRVEYAVSHFPAPRQVEYRTRLAGVDRNWRSWSFDGHRDFTSLPAGSRWLEIQARNSLGQVSPVGRFRVSRQPYWYQTWPAFAGYGLGALLLLSAVVRWGSRRRTRRIEQERLRLSRLVEEQTAELRSQTRRLTAEQEAKSRFFANVSHELRTPLTLTLGPLEDLASGRAGDLPPGASRPIGLALNNARHLRSLVDQVLDIGRLEAGAMPVAAYADDLVGFTSKVAERFRSAAKRSGKTLNLPEVGIAIEAYFDPLHLDRVVANLLSNALKFTPPGGQIRVSVFRADPWATIEVEDNGQGISEEDQSRVFDRYFQSGQTPASQPGTGIGLALVRELIELHSGEVSVRSQLGEGSTFSVSLPLGREHFGANQLAQEPLVPEKLIVSEAATSSQAELSVEVTDDEPPGEVHDKDAMTLLIVDDNAELRDFLRQRFVAYFRVREAADGVEALEECRRSLPDLVVSDVMMPRMDGIELTQRIRSDRELEFLPIILLTARTEVQDAVTGLGVGADDYLRKPFDTEELLARVERLIESRRQLRARFAAPEPVEGLDDSDSEFDRRLLNELECQIESGGLSVQSLADALAMDRTNLYRRVQSIRGISPQELIRKAKLQTAARMLAAGDGSVTEVAYSVGFKSLGHFSDSFRRHFGVPPSRWSQHTAR